MWLLNKFFGYSLTTYGTNLLKFTGEEHLARTDPMIVMFPRITKCTYQIYGASGSIESNDLMCVMPLNVINEKIFVFLWVWLIMLTMLTTTAILNRILTLFVPAISRGLLQRHSHLRIPIGNFGKNLQYGDFLLLFMIEKNVDTLSFTALMKELVIHDGNLMSDSYG